MNISTTGKPLLTAAVLTLVALGNAQTKASGSTQASRPNIIFMLSDDQSWNGLSVSMHPQLDGAQSSIVETPNLERLAMQGMRFSAAYSPASVCAPTRISLLTGRTPAALHWTKAARSVSAADGHKMIPPVNIRNIARSETTHAELLHKAGYRTAHYGKWHIQGGGPGQHGFDEHDGNIGNEYAQRFKDPNPADIFGMATRATAFMEKSKKAGQPFFIQLSWHALHAPENALKKTLAKYEARSNGRGGKTVSRAAIAEDLDTGVGRVLDAVDRLGLAGNTYVIYMSDNGGGGGGGGQRNRGGRGQARGGRGGRRGATSLKGGKGSLWEGGIRVPLIVRGPSVKPGSFCDVPVSGIDWFPTWCEWAGVAKLPRDLEGGSIAKLLKKGGQGVVQRPKPGLVFHFPHYQSGDGPHSTIRVADLKLIKFYEDNRLALFDLSTDLGEQRDLAKAKPKQVKELHGQLSAYLKAVNAQMPRPNPRYDPSRPPTPRKQRGGGRGRDGSGDKDGGRRRKRDRRGGDGDAPASTTAAKPASEIVLTRQARTAIDKTKATGDAADPPQASAFRAFAKTVKVRWDDDYLYIESDGMPDHPMMVGIRAWNQQVPIAQPYKKDNAFRIPRRPVLADKPTELPFLGPVAVAVNGVPIFNPIKQDGRTDTAKAGELDEFGGHAGRADDYHYHKAPLHLQKAVGKGKPIAYAMDGFPIYGQKDLNTKKPMQLDSAKGHSHPLAQSHTHDGKDYHYHSSTEFPYIMGKFRGVVERTNHPRAQGVRPFTRPLRGARIVGFTNKEGWYRLEYVLRNGGKSAIRYRQKSTDSYEFQFIDERGEAVTQTYTRRQRGGQRRGRAEAGRGGQERRGQGQGGRQGRRRGGEQSRGQAGAKPAVPTTIKANVYADNWFEMYINGKLVAVDPIDFRPHNVVSVDVVPSYPMVIAIRAKDHSDAKTGLEYENTQIGDGGLIVKFSDGTVSSAKWKVKRVFWGPIDGDIKRPRVGRAPIPKDWFTKQFDDSAWLPATEHSAEAVRPNAENFEEYDWNGAKFIWAGDLELDNTVLFRARIDSPTSTAPRAGQDGRRGEDQRGRGAQGERRGGRGEARRRRGQDGGEGGGERRGGERGQRGQGGRRDGGEGEGARQPWLVVHSQELDTDKNGSITKAELTSQSELTFKMFDQNADGRIMPSELERGGRGSRLAMAGFVRGHSQELDLDSNGSIGKDEILTTFERMFRRADRDGDGVATKAELTALGANNNRRGGGQRGEGGQRGRGASGDAGGGRRGGDRPRNRDGDTVGANGGRDERLRISREIRGTAVFRTTVPARPIDVVLGRPTKTSITVSVLSHGNRQGYLEFGTTKGNYSSRTETEQLTVGVPKEFGLTKLQPNQRYYYRVCYREGDRGALTTGREHTFHTARPSGSPFVFTVQADSHLDDRTEPKMYVQTLRNALADGPDFHFALGDTFMTGKRRRDHTQALPQYLAQRYYFGQLCHSVPLFFALGNHDGEHGYAENVAIWSNRTRKRFFPNPVPDEFYAGSATPHPRAGLLQNYYSFEWGDALFLVLDPFWYTASKRGDSWSRTLGREQYDWLQRTLETSEAKFQFVFLHHLVGGADRQARGGVAAARFFEWGGRELDGRERFAAKRPGWAMPIHDLLVRHGVEAVFHGHDHMFAKEELDGVVYQLVPQPGHPGNSTRSAEEYGYVHGDVLPSPGHVRVSVNADRAVVDFVQANQQDGGRGRHRNGAVGYTYTVSARGRKLGVKR